MADMSDFTRALEVISQKPVVFLAVKGDVGDFTSSKPATLIVMAEGVKMNIPLSADIPRLTWACGQLGFYLAGSEKRFIGWDIKNLFSYVLGRLKKPFKLEGKILDLKIMEWYVGMDSSIPTSFDEAKTRLAAVLKHPSWPDLKKVFGNVYIPLITEVIPEIETLGVMHVGKRKRLHGYYEIAGQNNGRMKCSNAYLHSFNPHTTAPEEREQMRPPLFDHVFLYLDYRNMEVSMLQWLSGDPVLGEILESGDDVYNAIWKVLTGMEANSRYRDMSKGTFLPVTYGLGAEALAEKNQCKPETAKKLVQKIYQKFPVSMGWIKRQVDAIGEDGWAKDYLGKMRQFPLDELYKARNFFNQSPASMVCLDKLVLLHKALKGRARIGFHVHDGYVVFAPKYEYRQIQDIATQCLEAESPMFPGLKLKVSCKVGEDWGKIA